MIRSSGGPLGRYHDVPERARVDPGGRQPCVRPLQPQAQRGAEHPAARRAAVALRPAVAHPGQAQPVLVHCLILEFDIDLTFFLITAFIWMEYSVLNNMCYNKYIK